MAITFTHHGNFRKTDSFFERCKAAVKISELDRFGQEGVRALRDATPKDSGLTAESWYYEIERKNGSTSIVWKNSNVVDGWANVAVLLQYGHGTRNGGYVQGRDYINPAIRPIFDRIAENAWKEIRKK